MMYGESRYQKGAVGGTFDRLHRGHEALLHRAFSNGERVVVGVTADNFVVEKQLASLIQPQSARIQALMIWVREHFPEKEFEVVSLTDVYGTTTSDGKIDGLVVSQETTAGAELVNQRRREMGWKALATEVVPMVCDEAGAVLDSTRIRFGRVSREGVVYPKIFGQRLEMTQDQREALKAPMGRVVATLPAASKLLELALTIAVVGDESVKTFIESGVEFEYGVVDRKTKRVFQHDLPATEGLVLCARNDPGSISVEAMETVKELLKQPRGMMQIEGEEDLLVIGLLLLLPLSSLVVYGQPDQGLVFVEVTEETKGKWYRFLVQR